MDVVEDNKMVTSESEAELSDPVPDESGTIGTSGVKRSSSDAEEEQVENPTKKAKLSDSGEAESDEDKTDTGRGQSDVEERDSESVEKKEEEESEHEPEEEEVMGEKKETEEEEGEQQKDEQEEEEDEELEKQDTADDASDIEGTTSTEKAVDEKLSDTGKECEDSEKVVENGNPESEKPLAEDLSTKLKETSKYVDGSAKGDDVSVHSEDSEKENFNTDLPMDLSTKSSSSGNAPDVIMLSDESDEDGTKLMNGDKEMTVDEVKVRKKLIKRLQAELRNEEAKLVLLKKLRQSQMSHQLQEQNNIVNNKIQSPQRQQGQHQSQPPPLIRGSQQQQQQQQVQARPAHSQPPQLMRGNQSSSSHKQQSSQGPPPLVMAPRMDNRHMMQQGHGHMRGMVQGNSPANLMPSFRGGNQSVQHLQQQQQQQAAAQRVVEETPAQRQAAAKLALRKQLEKTLLQIPPPKPPPPEMNFIPNLASPDFIYLLGLEEAVNFIIDANLISKGRKNPDEKMVCNPFTCVQCNTDFTPVWKREKPGSKNVICEQCVTTNQKKALKQEHTNRLKSAFVKALQQEQEIERMQSAENAKPAAPAPPPPAPTTTHNSSSSSSSIASSYKQQQASMADTLRQHQNLIHAHHAAASLRMGQPLGLQGFNPRSPFPYQLPFAARASDIQRQYLLDMIPKGGLPWTS